MICEKCQAPLVEGKKFCGQCGTPVSTASTTSTSNRCSGCGNELTPDKKFCGVCGRPVQEQAVTAPVLIPAPPVDPSPELRPQVAVDPIPPVPAASTGFADVQVPVAAIQAKQGSSLPLFGLIGVVVLLLGAAAYFGMQVLSPSKQKTDMSQEKAAVTYGGIVTQAAPPIKSDDQLTADIQSSLHAESALGNEPIRIRVTRGVVIMDGSVSSPAARALAERKVSQVKGVKTLIDNLTVK